MTWLHMEQTVPESFITSTSPLLTLLSPQQTYVEAGRCATCSQTRLLHSSHGHTVLVSMSLCFKQTIAPSRDQRGVILAAPCFVMNLGRGTSAKQSAPKLSALT